MLLLRIVEGDEIDLETGYCWKCACRVMIDDALGRREDAVKLLAELENNHEKDQAFDIPRSTSRRPGCSFISLNRAFQLQNVGMPDIAPDP